jgi:hypothetical protein
MWNSGTGGTTYGRNEVKTVDNDKGQPAVDGAVNECAGRADAEGGANPPRLRLPLATIDDVKREMARLYREGKAGRRDVADVSRLANVLALLGRLIEGADLEARLAALEEQRARDTERTIDITPPRALTSDRRPW